MKDASYQKVFTDFPEIKRTYNSRSIYTGYFGFGWCSNLEKSLIIKSPQEITLKDCDLESPYVLMDENTLLKTRVFENPMTKERILFRSGIYSLSSKNGDLLQFNRNGQMTTLIEPNGKKISYLYTQNILNGLKTNSNHTLKFLINDTHQIFKIEGPKNISAIYLYEKENLIQSVDSLRLSYLYEYDKLNNLIRLTHPDKTEDLISYNNDFDRVVKIQLKNQCIEYYDFATVEKEPLHQVSNLIRKCGNKIIHQFTYEFWYQTRPDGAKYLERYKINQHQQTLDITYHPYDGSPTRILKNGKDLIRQI